MSGPSLLPPKRPFSLSVSGRVLLFTVVVWVGLLLGLHGVLTRVFQPTFVQIESNLMVKDLERIEAAVAREAEQLGSTARDYASWGEMRALVSGSTVLASDSRTFNRGMLRTLDLDAIFVFDDIGKPRHALHEKSAQELAETKEYTPSSFASEFPVIATARTSSESSSRRGLVRFSGGKLVFAAAAPIVAERADTPALGTVVMLRELDEAGISRLSDQVRLPLDLVAEDPRGPAPAAQSAEPRVQGGTISASAWIRDPFGQPIARVSVQREASILGKGAETLNLAGVGSLAMLSVVLLLLLGLLQWSIVRPLRRLTRSMESVRRTGDLTHRVGMSRSDEIGLLAYNFDRLLDLLGERTRVLENLATTDGLTRLLNRRTIMEHLEKQLEEAEVEEGPLAVLLLDIDHFKRINDTAGHGVGDRVLRQVAATLRRSVRADDRAGRYGGEEFLLVLPHLSRDQALSAAERIRQAVAQEKVQGLDWNVTVSIGVACLAGHTAHGLLATADMNLYRAKESGRNKVVADEIPFSRLPAASIPPPAPRISSNGPRIVNGPSR